MKKYIDTAALTAQRELEELAELGRLSMALLDEIGCPKAFFFSKLLREGVRREYARARAAVEMRARGGEKP